jgi:hypothetical protein
MQSDEKCRSRDFFGSLAPAIQGMTALGTECPIDRRTKSNTSIVGRSFRESARQLDPFL